MDTYTKYRIHFKNSKLQTMIAATYYSHSAAYNRSCDSLYLCVYVVRTYICKQQCELRLSLSIGSVL